VSFDGLNQDNLRLVALKRQVEQVEQELKQRGQEDNLDHEPEYAVLFTGNWQSAIPNQLICHPDLSPAEKVTWQVWRLAITNPGRPGASPRSSDLMRHINCSKPTLTGTKAMLRVTRWATLCRSVRNLQGRFLGDIYLLHDEPMSLAATIELDSEYLRFLDRIISSEKKNKRLRAAAAQIIQSVRQEELSPQQTGELERCVNNLSLFKEGRSGYPVYSKADQKTTQDKKFNLDKEDVISKMSEADGQIHDAHTQDKNFNMGENTEIDENLTQVKKLTLDNTRLKNFFTASSSSKNNNKYKNNIYARAHENENVFMDGQSVHGFITSNIPMIGSLLADLWEQVFIAREKTIPIIIVKLKPLPRGRQINVLCQLLGRLIQADKDQAPEVRDVVKYCHSLIKAELDGSLVMDEYALRIKESVEEEMPLVI
jgi:hypothetical protein